VAEQGYSIGEAARAAGVSIKAIRYYEEIGLIPRTRRRANGGRGAGHRVFTAADVGRLRFIHYARALGVGLPEVRKLVAIAEEQGCPGSRPEYREILSRHLGSINERIARLSQLRTTLEGLMDAERPGAEGGCTWETCGCMEAADSAPQGGVRPANEPPSLRNKGGIHV
jgi:DNA-binding transcriptional MerR regulator